MANDRLKVETQPAERDGHVPRWAAGVHLEREYRLLDGGLAVRETLSAGANSAAQVSNAVYRLPAVATGITIDCRGGNVSFESGRRVSCRPGASAIVWRVEYMLPFR